MPPSRTAIAAHFGLANFPVAYCGLKIITSLALRFPDFQRLVVLQEYWHIPDCSNFIFLTVFY
ncbi:hypothetical protein BAZMOX_164073_1 [methanotrophic endosymbiont of Bathymodiolus azoricus (Menez Gwen)]|nr:hypothetical protein BAZMOX_164073_1 [methanotrophic endosymbiont of Bathymodiolus azoricus (Menez Gwen)]